MSDLTRNFDDEAAGCHHCEDTGAAPEDVAAEYGLTGCPCCALGVLKQEMHDHGLSYADLSRDEQRMIDTIERPRREIVDGRQLKLGL